MAISFVRKPSETPHINNIDDIIPFRYAYGNQNGYVQGKGSELSCTIDNNNFRLNSGRVVLQGVESDIDANGVLFTLENINELRYYVIYYNVNLATNSTSINIQYSLNNYPEVPNGDDLTTNTSGSANLELYRFTLMNGVIDNVVKTVNSIRYYKINKLTIDYSLTTNSKFLYNKVLENKLLYIEVVPTSTISNQVSTLTITKEGSISFDSVNTSILNANDVYRFYPTAARRITSSDFPIQTSYIGGFGVSNYTLVVRNEYTETVGEVFYRGTTVAGLGVKISGTSYSSSYWDNDGAILNSTNSVMTVYYLD